MQANDLRPRWLFEKDSNRLTRLVKAAKELSSEENQKVKGDRGEKPKTSKTQKSRPWSQSKRFDFAALIFSAYFQNSNWAGVVARFSGIYMLGVMNSLR